MGKKDTFCHWEYSPLPAIKMAEKKPCRCRNVFKIADYIRTGPSGKKNLFGVTLPTHQNAPYPTFFLGFSEVDIFFSSINSYRKKKSLKKRKSLPTYPPEKIWVGLLQTNNFLRTAKRARPMSKWRARPMSKWRARPMSS